MPRAALVIALVLAVAAPAGARTVDYKNVVSPTKQISCITVKPVAGGGIECTAPYLPRKEFDPYYALRAHGRTKTGERSDYPGYNVPRRVLHYDDTWKRGSVSCKMRTSGLTCHNLDGHGFRIARGALRRF